MPDRPAPTTSTSRSSVESTPTPTPPPTLLVAPPDEARHQGVVAPREQPLEEVHEARVPADQHAPAVPRDAPEDDLRGFRGGEPERLVLEVVRGAGHVRTQRRQR